MIDLAVIAGTHHLDDLSGIGTIDMALTHLVLAEPRQAAYFAARAAAGTRVLLDNSAYELETITGQGLAAEPVMRAANLIGASVVVCQDVLYDGPATLATTRRFLDQARTLADPDRVTFMGVPQGRTRGEWLDCYHRLVDTPGIAMIGLSKLSVPRCFAAPVAEARLDCVTTLLADKPSLPLHLLGGDRSLPWELAQHRDRGHDEFICGNDSSFAFWYAACDLHVDPVTGRAPTEAPGKPDLETTTLDPPRLAAAYATIALLRDAVGLLPLGNIELPEPTCR